MPSKAALARPRDKSLAFPEAMIQAFLREAREPGTGKSQHRVVLKPQPEFFDLPIGRGRGVGRAGHPDELWPFRCMGTADERDFECWARRAVPPYAVGDRIWVREAHYLTDDGDSEYAVFAAEDDDVREHLASIDGLGPSFPAEIKARHRRLRPAAHLPRWASRLTLLVTEVRVERLQSISEADARAEGVEHDSDGWRDYLMPSTQCCGSASDSFYTLWNSLHGPDAWAANPWCCVPTLRPTLANIDAPPPEADLRREARSDEAMPERSGALTMER